MTSTKRARARTALLTCLSGLLFAIGCGEDAQRAGPFGGDGSAAPVSDAPSTATLVISRSGLSVRTLRIAQNGRLTVLNDDSVAHQLASDDHPTHELCAELNLPRLAPGSAITVSVGQGGRTCTVHDEDQPAEAAFRGAIEIVAPQAQPD